MTATVTTPSTRDISLDVMRLIGLLMIILAHVDPPEWLRQLRNFGTPLLIVASAATYAVIYDRRAIDVPSFYQKRLTRLVIPVWTFLSIFFGSMLVVAALSDRSFPFTARQVFETFTFGRGIGYVWIFPVYMALAIITPVGLRLAKQPLRDGPYALLLLGGAIVYELLRPVLVSRLGDTSRLALLAMSVLPYGLLYLYGLRLTRFASTTLAIAAALAAAVFAWQGVIEWQRAGDFVPTQTHRFPPTAYYLSYAFYWINLIALACRGVKAMTPHTESVIRWASANSLWIYLWHVAALFAWNYARMPVRLQSLGAWTCVVSLVAVLLMAVTTTALQRRVVTRWSTAGTRTARLIRLTLA